MLDCTAPVMVESRFIPAPDGLSLHVRCYGPATDAQHLPVLCLPGLTRNEADFEPLAHASGRAMQRIRAASSRSIPAAVAAPATTRTGATTIPLSNLRTCIAVMAALGLDRAVFVGTSRGGILTMLLATVQPALIAGALLNDIGPVDRAGRADAHQALCRPDSAAAGLCRRRRDSCGACSGRNFRAWTTPTGWPGRIAAGAETVEAWFRPMTPSIAETLNDIIVRISRSPISGRNSRRCRNRCRLMVIRGALSDILSAETVAAMRQRRPDWKLVEVRGSGSRAAAGRAATILADFGLPARAATGRPGRSVRDRASASGWRRPSRRVDVGVASAAPKSRTPGLSAGGSVSDQAMIVRSRPEAALHADRTDQYDLSSMPYGARCEKPRCPGCRRPAGCGLHHRTRC